MMWGTPDKRTTQRQSPPPMRPRACLRWCVFFPWWDDWHFDVCKTSWELEISSLGGRLARVGFVYNFPKLDGRHFPPICKCVFSPFLLFLLLPRNVCWQLFIYSEMPEANPSVPPSGHFTRQMKHIMLFEHQSWLSMIT